MASPERDALTIEEYRQYVERTTRERDFQRMVEDFAHHMGWSLTYHTYDSRRSDEGFPDLVAIRDERLLFAELKVGRGKLRPAQIVWQAALQEIERVDPCHVTYRLWYPRDWDDIVATLRRAS